MTARQLLMDCFALLRRDSQWHLAKKEIAAVNDKLIRSIFWALVAVFVIVVCTMVIPSDSKFIMYLGFCAWFFFFGLGVTLIVLTVKMKVEGKLKKFLLFTGSSAVGIPVFAILSNAVYALLIYFFGENFWGAGGDEPFFFIMAIIVCPIAFVVGTVGTIVLTVKNKPGVPVETP